MTLLAGARAPSVHAAETQGEKEWHRLTLTALALVFGSLVSGLVEAALFADGPEHVWLTTTTIFVWIGIVLAPLAVVAAQPLLPLFHRVAVLGYSWWRIIVVLGMLFGLIAAGFAGWYVWWKGIILSAIDYRPLIVFAAGFFSGLIVYFGLLGYRRAARLALPIMLMAGLAVSCWALLRTHTLGAAVERLSDDGGLSRYPAHALRQLMDRDHDGYPGALCDAVCDCNDQDPAVSPAALEIPNNGIDDDCFEGDLKFVPTQETGGADVVGTRVPERPLGDVTGPWVERPNILLITIDTLRADHLGTYGYSRPTSPNLDALAAASVRFDQARSQGPMTRFSVPSLITGRYFSELKRTTGQWPQLQPETVTMAELLRDGGYHTFSFHSIGYLMPIFGFAQGFDYYDVSVIRERDPVHWHATSDLVTDRILGYFDQRVAQMPAGQPWFLWAYYGDPHSGYVKHDELPSFGTTIYDVYDQEILFTDLHIGRLLDGLRERHELDTTVIIVTSDHGEGLEPEQDHGFQYHGQHLHDNLLRVPLIVQVPGAPPAAIARPVANLDVLPTVLDLSGVERPRSLRMHGVSLVPYLFGQDVPHPPVFSEKVTTTQYPQKSMVAWPYKLIWKIGPNQFQLFDLAKDPGELRDLTAEQPIVLEQLKRQMQVWRATVLEEIPAIDEPKP